MGKINLDFFQLLILFASVQGLIFGTIILFLKKYKSKSSKYIALTVFMVSLTNVHHIIVVDYDFIPIISIIRKIYIPWQSLATVGLFLFINSIFGKDRLDKRTLLMLFGPFFIIFCFHSGQFMYQLWFDESFIITRYYEKGLFLYTNLAAFIYGPFLMNQIDAIIRIYNNSNTKSADKIELETGWIKRLIRFGKLLFLLGFLSVAVIIILDLDHSFAAYPFLLSTSIWVYWIAIAGLNKTAAIKKSLTSEENGIIKEHSSIKIGLGTFQNIEQVIQIDKPYLNPAMSLTSLAEQFNISNGYLSQLINVHTEKSFSDYINEFRVKDSQLLLLDKSYDHYTIESIGLECGFKSKSNFYTAFKKFSGLTPNEYKKVKKLVLNDHILENTEL